MSDPSKRCKASSRGLLSSYRYLRKRAMLLCAVQAARARKKRKQMFMITDIKSSKTENDHDLPDTQEQIKKRKLNDADQVNQTMNCANKSKDECKHSFPLVKTADHSSLTAALTDSWEVDSGFHSEASPPASGRSSPCLSTCPTTVVALDCEMVGTGPGGRCSELARCSIVDYHGHVLFDQYVKPHQPVTDFRTRWSGIKKHHLHNATPFTEAREQILKILEGKVVVGHSIYHDFEALDILHPGHMVRDTSTVRLLGRLAGFPRGRCTSLKVLTRKLLNRNIQVGRSGHCSVEDARASLDLYKLVEGEWEQELQKSLRDEDDDAAAPLEPSSDHYMQDEYWPSDVDESQ
ncbi:apoptosis-enhancing nuclease-like [Salarias fasciatus]|uniref:Apoptosis-enhancing nuclease-like n=1 Tax=Salarias fasciatus TaxID=181472 RepID=A0A672F796_SALFA|nr:apoptosis-enhancing nuclease-like [Salarias fasciatus]